MTEETGAHPSGVRQVESHVGGARGEIEKVEVLNLTPLTSAEELHEITAIRKVETLIVPDSLAAELAAIPLEQVETVIRVPDGATVRTLTGSVTMSGDAFAGSGRDNEVLVVTGSLLITSPVTTVGYREIVTTGLVLAPHGSEAVLGSALSQASGAVSYYTHAENQEIKDLSGQLKLSGESLANTRGSADDILVVSGQFVVTTPPETVGYRRVIVVGQLIAPREGRAALEPVLTVYGQTAWYGGDNPRFMLGGQRFSRVFFESLADPITLVQVGRGEIDDDVPVELIRAKITEIAAIGTITASADIIGVVQALATEMVGRTVVRGDEPAHD